MIISFKSFEEGWRSMSTLHAAGVRPNSFTPKGAAALSAAAASRLHARAWREEKTMHTQQLSAELSARGRVAIARATTQANTCHSPRTAEKKRRTVAAVGSRKSLQKPMAALADQGAGLIRALNVEDVRKQQAHHAERRVFRVQVF
jgi:hypothetical protein